MAPRAGDLLIMTVCSFHISVDMMRVIVPCLHINYVISDVAQIVVFFEFMRSWVRLIINHQCFHKVDIAFQDITLYRVFPILLIIKASISNKPRKVSSISSSFIDCFSALSYLTFVLQDVSVVHFRIRCIVAFEKFF